MYNEEEQTYNRFHIALSFPGEHRDFVLQVAEELANKLTRDRVFYDEWYEVELLGAGGDLKLQSMYKQADLVVPFFSEHYSKSWCSLEWETIRGILLDQRKGDKVIPVHLDDTDIPGWSAVDFGIQLKGRTPQEIAHVILKALIRRINLPPETIISSPKPEQEVKLQLFEFDVVTVDESGQIVKREKGQAQYLTEDLGNGVTLDMISIPGGTFQIGSPENEGEDDEQPQHEVTVLSFFMGKYPITQAQYERVMGENPSHFNFKGDDQPVQAVSWDEAVEFCRILSFKTEKEYRLPTEAEWEYACRAGTTTPFHFGETISTELANYRGTDWDVGDKVYPGNYGRGEKGIYREQTTPVGYFKVANNFGLYDMHGNVREWCKDEWINDYRDYRSTPKFIRPISRFFDFFTSYKVIRGGSWCSAPVNCRSAYRGYSEHGVYRPSDVGFRVVCKVR